MSFERLNVRPEISRALRQDGVETPTNIQLKSIPPIMEGKDVIGTSKTGSGKTIAFAAPLIGMVKPNQGLQVMVIAPTRELAVQISKEFSKFGRHLKVATVFGGMGMQPQIEALARAEILVATPGRTLDHLQRGNMDLSKIWCVVLDEADKMVEMGFIEDINRILSQTPQEKQVLLFGATIGEEIEHLKEQHMSNPVYAIGGSRLKEDVLKQYYYNIRPHEKFSMLIHLLKKREFEKSLVFCSTRKTVELVTKNLRKQGFKADMIHGKLSQNRRLHAMNKFNRGGVPILVASAVAARGIHIGNVTHVINYDLSQDAEEYIHRVGRTARAGEKGMAITLLAERDYDAFDKVLDRLPMDVKELPRERFARVPFDTGASKRRRGSGRHRRKGSPSHHRGKRRRR